MKKLLVISLVLFSIAFLNSGGCSTDTNDESEPVMDNPVEAEQCSEEETEVVELSGSGTDPSFDNLNPNVISSFPVIYPDLIFAEISISDNLVDIGIDFRDGTFDPDIHLINIFINLDQDENTGDQNLPFFVPDNELKGIDAFIGFLTLNAEEVDRDILQLSTFPFNGFTVLTDYTIQENGISISFPLSLLCDENLPDINGPMEFKVSTDLLVSTENSNLVISPTIDQLSDEDFPSIPISDLISFDNL